MANQEHVDRLKLGVKSWNAWRAENPDVRANLDGANLTRANGNSREVKSVQTTIWVVTYTAEVMQIGCQRHEIAKWWAFTDDEISRMERRALEWWKTWKPILQQIIEVSPAMPTGYVKQEESGDASGAPGDE